MNELKLIEKNGLIKVYETNNGEKIVNARELHEGLCNKRQFADWIKQRITEVDAIENEDFVSISQNCEKPIGGRPTIEYWLKLPTAKEMAMLERNEKGKAYRRYLIAVEEKYKTLKNDPYTGLSPELQAIFITDKKVQAVEARVDKLENTMTIDYTQQEALRELANKTVIDALGGKGSLAYKMIGSKAFSEIWRYFKRTMNVNSYKNTAVVDYEKAKKIIVTWKPDKELGLMITGANVQGGERV